MKKRKKRAVSLILGFSLIAGILNSPGVFPCAYAAENPVFAEEPAAEESIAAMDEVAPAENTAVAEEHPAEASIGVTDGVTAEESIASAEEPAAEENNAVPGETPSLDANRVTCEVPGGKLYFEPDTGTITWAEGDMEELTIPDKIKGTEVRVIKRWGLSGLKKLKKIKLPGNRNILGEGSLAELVSLEDCEIPTGYDTIPQSCFYGCTALKRISLPSGITAIGKMAFYQCKALEMISMPASLTSIDEMAFYECPSLEYVDIPGNCMRIGRMAFYSCTGLKGVAFASGSACDISEWGIFYNCNSLERVVNNPSTRFRMFCESGKRAVKWLDTPEMIQNQTELWRLRFPTEDERNRGIKTLSDEEISTREAEIRSLAQEITRDCGTDREKIEAVMQWIIGRLEYEMGHDNHPWAIYTGIREMEAGKKSEQLNSCGGYSAMTQVLLQSLGIPCATLWREARNGESIDHVFCAAYYDGKWRWLDTTHSDNRKEGLELDVGISGFFFDSDHRVDYLLYRSGKNGDTDIYKELPLDIPVEEDRKDWPDLNPEDAYTAGEAAQDPDWKHETDPAEIKDEQEKIALRASEFPDLPVSDGSIFDFDKATGTITGLKGSDQTSIRIPESIDGVTVRAIGEGAFQNMRKLEYVTMPDTITEIGKYAFANNSSLKRVHLSAALTEMKEGLFQNCGSLDSITIPASVKRLDKSIFRNCGSLEEALFEDYAFKIRVIETDPLGSDNNYDSGLADISWYCFAGMSGRALHGLDFHETYQGTKFHRQLREVTLTDDWRQNIVNVHQSQMGYREGFSPYHLDGSNSKEYRLSGRAVDYEWGHFAEASRFTGYQPATWCRAFIDWAYAMAGVKGYKSTEYQWEDTVYAGGTITLEPGDMLGMGKSHWCMVGSVKELADSVEIWILHGNHNDRKVGDEVRHYDKKTGIAMDMEDEDYNYFRAIYKIDFSGLKTRTVTLDPVEGHCDVKSRIYCEGAYYGCLPEAVREDYVFDGWYTEPEGGLRAYPYRNLGEGVTTLYAHYTYDPKAVKGVELNRDRVKLTLGKQLTLKASVLPTDAKDPSVTWRSGNDGVVSVRDGVIKGLKEGRATIMARTVEGPYVAYCEVEVVTEGGEGEEGSGEEGEKTSCLPIAVKQKIDLSEKGYFGTAFNNNDVFVVEPKGIGTVARGIFTAKKAGKVTITRKIRNGKQLEVAGAVSFLIDQPVYFKNGKKDIRMSEQITVRGVTIAPKDWIDMTGALVKPDFYACADKKGVVAFDASTGSAEIRKTGTAKITAYYGSDGGKDLKKAAKLVYTIRATLPTLKDAKVKAGKKTTVAVTRVAKGISLTSDSWSLVEVDEEGNPKPDVPSGLFTIVPVEKRKFQACEVTAPADAVRDARAALVVTVDGVDYWSIITVK